jgi:2'-5' RNA ligase
VTSRAPESARLFVALDLPVEARSALVEWREGAVGSRADLRLVSPDALHVTLAFIGHRPVADVEAIGAAVVGAVDGLAAALLRPLAVAPLPPRRPRLFALDLHDEGERAGAVQAAVSDALAGGGWYEPEKRPFWPHVTFARVRRGERAGPIESQPPGEEFVADTVTLYRSRPSRRGASYEPLVQARLD